MNDKRRRTRIAAVAGAVALAAGGGGAALAASHADKGRDGVIGDAAARLHVEPGKLKSALEAAAVDRVEAAEKAGKITKERAGKAKARIRSGKGPLLGGAGGGKRTQMRKAISKAVAKYVGLSPAELHSERRSGKSLAQVAAAHGKSVEGLEGAILAAAKTELDKAVKAGRITADAEQKRLDKMKSRIAVRVVRTGHGGRHRTP